MRVDDFTLSMVRLSRRSFSQDDSSVFALSSSTSASAASRASCASNLSASMPASSWRKFRSLSSGAAATPPTPTPVKQVPTTTLLHMPRT